MRALAVLVAVMAGVGVAAEDGSVWDGVYTPAQAKQGAKLFVEHCVACHSTKPGEMSGHGPAPSVIGEDFEYRWLDSSVADLFDAIRQTMPEGAPNSLGVDEYAAVTAYVFQLNGYPAGAKPMKIADYELWKEVWIEAGPGNLELPSAPSLD